MEDGQHLDNSTNNNVSSQQDESQSCGLHEDPTRDSENNPGDSLKNVKNVLYIYRQDVVRSTSKNQIGVVTEVAGDSDSDSSITDDEDEDDDDDYEHEKDDEAASTEEGDAEKSQNLDESATLNADDNDYKHNPLTAGQVRVLWMDGSETTESTNGITVVDRGFLHGDYVASVADPTGQIGLVVDANINVDLLAHDGSILKDIPSRQLRRIRDFTVGDHVVLGPWLGRIEDVFDNVTVQLDDGSVCKVVKADPLHLIPVSKNILEDGHFPYYPGQRVKASSSSVFKNSRWLSGLWKANRLEGTVTKVTVGSVFIHWIASAGYGLDSASTPAEEQSPKNLKLLSCFVHSNWQLGDWCLLPSTRDLSDAPLNKELSKLDSQDSAKDEFESMETGDESDSEMATEGSAGNDMSRESDVKIPSNENTERSDNNVPVESSSNSSAPSSKEVIHETWPFRHKKIRKVVVRKDKKVRKKVENFERAFLIINSRTTVDVAWQDSTIQRGLDSTFLIPIDSPGDHDFVAEQYVVEKAADANDSLDIRRVGVVKNVNAKDRTACVRWLKAVTRAEDPREFDKEEVVSVYELEGHPDYDYCYGDVVVRLSPISLPANMESFVHPVDSMPLNHSDESTYEKGRHHERDTAEAAPSHDMPSGFSDLTWVGNITGLKDGDIEVTWANGMISTVGPQAIYVVGRDDDESVGEGSDASNDAASWETVEDDIDTVDNAEKDVHDAGGASSGMEDDDIDAEDSGKNGALSIPMAALGFMSRLASGIFSMGRKHMDPSNGGIKSEDDFQPDELTLNRDRGSESSTQTPNGIDKQLSELTIEEEKHDVSGASDLLEGAEILKTLNPPELDATPHKEVISLFKGFDIVRDPSDHYFLGAVGQNNAARKWVKKIQRDWDILQNNLPEDIYVRGYEDRMDLLRAVIVGAYGTPYQDGLFFFDFHLPPEYPDVPPSAHYHSGGWRINPNLYEEGKVCLSLLNTWTGRGNEVWDPTTSSILQVLVSLQGLVLNSKPYFNEAGYDKQVGTAEGEKNSLSYNENAFILNCKTMMYLMRRPPKDFEELIVEHFRKRGRYILKACDAYLKGLLICSLSKDAAVGVNFNTDSNSVGFKLMLAKVVPKFFAALTEVGADCRDFEHLNSVQFIAAIVRS